MNMSQIQIFISVFVVLLFSGIQFSYASSEKSESSQASQSHHPPHDHHHTDHIKKLDEGMRKRRKDEEKSH